MPDSRSSLHPNTGQRIRAIRLGFSLDWWTVIAAGALAVLVRFALPPITW